MENTMKNTVFLMALAGFATTAVAQDFILSISGAPATIDASSGAVFTIDVIGDATIGTYINGAGFGLSSASNPMISNIQWTPIPQYGFHTDDGFDGEGNNGLVAVFNIQLPLHSRGGNFWDDLLLGTSMGQFQITLAPGSFGQLDLDLIAGATYFDPPSPFSMKTMDLDPNDPFGVWTIYSDEIKGSSLILNGASINVVPAPSALALLGLGGLAVSQRRR
jgi:hypothetical protein